VVALRFPPRTPEGATGPRVGMTLLLSFIVMLVPTIWMGVAFPLAGEARARWKGRLGESVGDLVGLNTAGAILGSLLAGFVLIPLLGVQRGMLWIASLFMFYGSLVLWMRSWSASPARWLRLAGTTSLLAFAFPIAAEGWDPRLMTAIPNNKARSLVDAQGETDVSSWLERTRLLYHREGRGSTVAVVSTGRVRTVSINGRIEASDHMFDLHHEYLLGHLPALLHPDPRAAVVVGLGAGITLGGIVAHESFERIVLVEIEPAVFGAARQFADLNDDALRDPRVEQVLQDGRNYLATTSRTFDVITADPLHPWTLGATYLYTREYYDMARTRLNPGGVMCQWLPLYELSLENVRSVIASFAGSFEHTTVWVASLDALLIGSDAPLQLDLDRLAARLRQPRVARQLARIGLDDAPSLLAEYVMDDRTVDSFSQGAIVNTDDNLYLEFSAPLRFGVGKVRANIRDLLQQRGNPAALVKAPGRVFDPATLEAQLARLLEAKAESLAAMVQWVRATESGTRAAYEQAVETARSARQVVPDYDLARHILAGCLSDLGRLRWSTGEERAAAALFDEALELDPGNHVANFHLALLRVQAQEMESARGLLEASLERKPFQPAARQLLGTVLSALGRTEEAVRELEESARQEPGRSETHHQLGLALTRLGRFEEAAAELERARAADPDSREIVTALADALVGAGRHGDAVAVLRQALARSPNRYLSLRLAWLLATSRDARVRDGEKARELAVEATRRAPDARSLDVLAAALAELGRSEEAVATAQLALAAARAEGREGHARTIQARLAGYSAGQALRE
jgi:spermidine synthase/Tfp pilus assembly protein PilF